MADPIPPARDHVAGHEPEARPGVPRWVKVFVVIAIVAIVTVVIINLAGGGDHGPGRHMSGSGADGTTAALSIAGATVVGGHRSPPAGHTS
jgi:hypothetical protein